MADFHPVTTIAPFVVDFSLGAFDGSGGVPPDGLYGFSVKNLKVMPAKEAGKVPQLSFEAHLDGTDGFRYGYVQLPTNPTHEHYKNQQRDFITFVLCVRPDLAPQLQGQMQITPDFIATFEGARGKLWFIGPMRDDSGKIDKNSRDEITFLTVERAAAIAADPTKAPTRRLGVKPATVGAGSLGATAGAAPTGLPQPVQAQPAAPAAVPSAIPSAIPAAVPAAIPAAIPQPPAPPVVPLPPR